MADYLLLLTSRSLRIISESNRKTGLCLAHMSPINQSYDCLFVLIYMKIY